MLIPFKYSSTVLYLISVPLSNLTITYPSVTSVTPSASVTLPFMVMYSPMYMSGLSAFIVISTVVFTVAMLVNSSPSRVLPVLLRYVSFPGYFTETCMLSAILFINNTVSFPVIGTFLVSPSTVKVKFPSVIGTLFSVSTTLTLIDTLPFTLLKMSTVVLVGNLFTTYSP